MSEADVRARLRSALVDLVQRLPTKRDGQLSRNDIPLLPEQEVRAAAECLMSLGLAGDALRMAESWRAILDWMIGPRFDEWLMNQASVEPDQG
jgi:hypothetical protein